MTPPESQEGDPFNTRPSQPLANFQTNWPGLDLSVPYVAQVDSTPPPPPMGAGNTQPEKQRWTHSTQAIAIGLLSVAVVLLSLVILSFHQGGIVGFFSTATSSNSSSTTNVQNTTSSNSTTNTVSTPSGSTSSGTSSIQNTPLATATTVGIVQTSAPAATATPTAVVPTATSTNVPAPTVTFTCQNVSGGGPGPRNVAQICVQTTPGAQMTIAALKCDSTPDGNLKPTGGTAGSAGNIQWSWNMQDPGPCKQEHVIVTAQVGSGQTGQNAVYLQFMH